MKRFVLGIAVIVCITFCAVYRVTQIRAVDADEVHPALQEDADLVHGVTAVDALSTATTDQIATGTGEEPAVAHTQQEGKQEQEVGVLQAEKTVDSVVPSQVSPKAVTEDMEQLLGSFKKEDIAMLSELGNQLLQEMGRERLDEILAPLTKNADLLRALGMTSLESEKGLKKMGEHFQKILLQSCPVDLKK